MPLVVALSVEPAYLVFGIRNSGNQEGKNPKLKVRYRIAGKKMAGEKWEGFATESPWLWL